MLFFSLIGLLLSFSRLFFSGSLVFRVGDPHLLLILLFQKVEFDRPSERSPE